MNFTGVRTVLAIHHTWGNSRSSWDLGSVECTSPLHTERDSRRPYDCPRQPASTTVQWQTALLCSFCTTQRSHPCSCYCGENIFVYTTWCDTQNNFKEFDKTKAILSAPLPRQNPNKPMCRVPFGSWDWLYYFGDCTGLLSNMLNVKGKESPGKYGKAITENALLEQGKHKAGLGEVSPPPTYPKHRRWNHVVENSPPQLPTVFIFRFTMGKESEMTRPSKSLYLPYNKASGVGWGACC